MIRASVSKTDGNPPVNPSSRARILLIEDEAKTARAVLNSMRAEGFAPVWVETGEDGFFVLSSQLETPFLINASCRRGYIIFG
jgi:PleD family two-component response regulator